MLIQTDGTIISEKDFEKYRVEKTTYYVKGLIYLSGHKCGLESILQIHEAMKKNDKVPFNRIYGAYSCCIVKPNNEILFFACNSEMQCLYISDNAISSSFIEHLEFLNKQNLQLTFDNESVCEYYVLGKIFFKKTFVNQVKMLPNDCYTQIKNNKTQILNKGIGQIDKKSNIKDPQQFFKDLAYALSEKKVCSALTGGYDSRMVVSMLYKNLPLKLFISSNNDKHSDVEAAKQVAEKINQQLTVYTTKKPAVNEEQIRAFIKNGDGINPVQTFDPRVQEFARKLADEGYNIMLSGDGGVLHKDWEWMQDLPFYHKKSTNLNRFYHQRIAFEHNTSCLDTRLKPVCDVLEAKTVERLMPYKKDINTRSYDFLYHYASGSQCLGYNTVVKGITAYAPLWELDLVRYSYHLPRKKRFFYNFIREMTTSASPDMARVVTCYGTTASSEARYLIRDIFFQFLDYARKGVRMLGRMLFHKTFLIEKLTEWSLEDDLRNFNGSKNTVDWAIKSNFLSEQANVKNLPYSQLTKIIHMYFLACEYKIAVSS